MQYPRMKIRNLNDITLNWENIFENVTNNTVFRLQICDRVKEWKTVYCGTKQEYKVVDLAPCTCYNFRIKRKSDTDWLNFKAATEDIGPYTSVMHMTRALKLGKTPIIRKIASIKPLLLNAENKEHKTPIVQALEFKDIQLLHLLIMLGANINKPLLYTNKTPLMIAVYRGHLQAAGLLMEKGANIFSSDINGLNILHYAVDSNELDNVNFAINTKVDINLQDHSGWTPLLRAAILNCKPEIIECLLSNGADPSIKDKNGFDLKKHLEITRLWRV